MPEILKYLPSNLEPWFLVLIIFLVIAGVLIFTRLTGNWSNKTTNIKGVSQKSIQSQQYVADKIEINGKSDSEKGL